VQTLEYAVGASSDEVSEIGLLLELAFARPAWHAEAACRQPPPGVTWFPEPGQDVRAAKAVCAACPVQTECRAWALAQTSDLKGVWGGISERERRQMRSRRRHARLMAESAA
jgi:WhiB family redox-sensing transcriptional regulator